MAKPPSVVRGPEPVETPDLHFKIYNKLKIFNSPPKYEGGNCSLLAVSQYYGLIFVGNLNGFSIIKIKSIKSSINSEFYPKKNITLTFQPTHLSVDFSQKQLAVVCSSKPGATLNLYSIETFMSQDVVPIKVLHLAELVGNLNAEVLELGWQPNSDGMLGACMSDGSFFAFSKNIKGEFVFCTLPNSTFASCFCWSPKGKQLVLGSTSGTLSQYKPDLKLVKTIPAPQFSNANVAVVSVLWISNYQFAVSYLDKSNSEVFPVITILNAAKNEPVTIVNYEDITYSNIFFRNHQIYMSHLSAWNLVFISSGNSMEVAVLHLLDNLKWEQWLLGDASRAELPLNADRQETFPLGMAFDYTSEDIMPWGEGTLPPMPKLLLLSSEGVLCIFNIINLSPNAPQLCLAPKETLDDSLFNQNQADTISYLSKSQEQDVIKTSIPFTEQSVFGSTKAFSFNSNNSFKGFSSEAQNAVPAPQVTISIQGKEVFTDIKDVSLLLQQQQQQKQQQQPSIQQPVSHGLVLSHQNAPNTQQIFTPPQNIQTAQPIIISTQKTTASLKFPANTTKIGTSAETGFSFGNSNTTSLFGSKLTLQKSNAVGNGITSKTFVSQEENIKGMTHVHTDIFSGKTNIIQSTPIKQATKEKETHSKGTTKNVEETEIQSEKNASKEKSPSESSSPVVPELPAVDDSVYWNALQEEINHFNSELHQLSVKISKLETEVGTEKDKENLRNTIEKLYEFRKDLKETTLSQNNEIHSVVSDLMESYAWVEDAKSRNLQRKNPNFIELKKAEELDPISARHMSDISHLKYYLENQIKQLTSHLEKEWMDYQDNYRKDAKNKLAVPPMEEIYRTMNFQLKILNKQRAIVEELKEKMAFKKRKNKSLKTLISNSSPKTSINQSNNRVLELSKLADNLLQLKINQEENLSTIENSEMIKRQMEMIIARTKKLTMEKQAGLRDILSERDMVKIRPIKTTFETSSFLRFITTEKLSSKASNTVLAIKPESKIEIKEKERLSSEKTVSPKPKTEIKSKKEVETETFENGDKNLILKSESSKSLFVFGNDRTEKPTVLSTPQELPNKLEEKSPLISLSSIVSNIGKESEPKSSPSNFTFQTFKFSNTEVNKDSLGLQLPGAKPQQKAEVKPAPTLTFNLRKPSESAFGTKTETSKIAGKPSIETVTTTISATTKSEEVKINPAISTIDSYVVISTSPSVFSFTSSTSNSLPFEKINFLNNKEQTSGVGVNLSTNSNAFTNASSQSSSSSIFTSSQNSAPIVGTAQNSDVPVFGSSQNSSVQIFGPSQNSSPSILGVSTSIFGNNQKNNTNTLNSSQTTFGISKTITETVTRPNFFTQSAENKVVTSTNEIPTVSIKTEVESEKINVVTVNEPGTTEASSESKNFRTLITTVAPSAVGENNTLKTPLVTKSLDIVSCTNPTSTVSVISVAQNATGVTTSSEFSKSGITLGADPASPTSASSIPLPTTTSLFSTTSSTPLIFNQASLTTTAGVFGQTLTTNSNFFANVSTTTTTSVFGSASIPTKTTNIFGGSVSTKPIFGQATTSTTPNSSSIFGNSSPSMTASNAFGGVTTPTSSAPEFGQKPDAVAQTSNIFGQLLTDSNKADNVFSSSPTTSTPTTNIFSKPKNIFSGAGNNTPSHFGGGSPSIFPQTTIAFGQSTTASNIFGSSNSFFGQNICSPFGNEAAVTSNQSSFESGRGFGSKPVFGQPVFGQSTNNTFMLGNVPTTSIFGGSPSSSSGSSFQTNTTSNFGSTSGPFSSGKESVAESGFQATNSFQKPLGGFGSPPVFGAAAPTFGAAPTFSSSSTFGSQPTFGSRPFDSTQGSFTQTQGHSNTFANLANQNTIGFGNLAQQSKSQNTFGTFGSTPAFENKSFGGSSFSSWRS